MPVRRSLHRSLQSSFASVQLIGGFDWSHKSDGGLLDGMKAVRVFKKWVGGLIGWISEARKETEHSGGFKTNCKVGIDES